MLSPIEILLVADGGGSPAQVNTPLVGSALDYDTGSSTDQKPSQPQKKDVRGIFADGYREGMETGETASFLIPATAIPAEMVPVISHLTLFGISYKITRYRTRIYRGAVDGYTLFLAA